MSHWNVVSVWLGFMLFFNLKMISWWHWNVPFFPHLYLFLQFNLPSIILRWDQVFNQSTQQQQLQFYFIWKINENWQKLKKEFKKYWFGISFSRTIPRAKTVQRYALHNIASFKGGFSVVTQRTTTTTTLFILINRKIKNWRDGI